MIKLIIFLLIVIVVVVIKVINSVLNVVAKGASDWLSKANDVLQGIISDDGYSNSIVSKLPPVSDDFLRRLSEQMDSLDKLLGGNRIIDVFAVVDSLLCLHMAKADGQISEDELKTIKESIKMRFGDDINHKLIQSSVSLLKGYLKNYNSDELLFSTVVMLETWVKFAQDQMKLSQEDVPAILIETLAVIYEVALTDGLEDNERVLFDRLLYVYGFDSETKEYIIRIAEYKENVRKNKSHEEVVLEEEKVKNALRLFGLTENFTEEELQKAWRNFVKFNHPDKYHNAGKEIYEKMNRDFVIAKDAYDLLLSKVKASDYSQKSYREEEPIKPKPEMHIRVDAYYQGLAIILFQNHYGYENENGAIVIEPKYEDARRFSEGLAAVRNKGKYGFINTKGELVIPFRYSNANVFQNGKAQVWLDGIHFEFIDTKGNKVVEATKDELERKNKENKIKERKEQIRKREQITKLQQYGKYALAALLIGALIIGLYQFIVPRYYRNLLVSNSLQDVNSSIKYFKIDSLDPNTEYLNALESSSNEKAKIRLIEELIKNGHRSTQLDNTLYSFLKTNDPDSLYDILVILKDYWGLTPRIFYVIEEKQKIETRPDLIEALKLVLEKRNINIKAENITASSYMIEDAGTHYPTNVNDGNLETTWADGNPEKKGKGEWLYFEFGRPVKINKIQIANGYFRNSKHFGDLYFLNSSPKTIALESEFGSETLQLDHIREWQTRNITKSNGITWMRIKILDEYAGTKWKDTCISEIRFLGYDSTSNNLGTQDKSNQTASQNNNSGTKSQASQYLQLGIQQNKEKRYEEAILSFEKAIDIFPTGELYFEYGNTLSILKRFEDSTKAFKEALKLGDDRPDLVLYNIACNYSLLKNTDLSYKYLELAINRGYKDFGHIKKDTDMEFMRSQPDWESKINSMVNNWNKY